MTNKKKHQKRSRKKIKNTKIRYGGGLFSKKLNSNFNNLSISPQITETTKEMLAILFEGISEKYPVIHQIITNPVPPPPPPPQILPSQVKKGIYNYGNTCYFNSAIQLLNNIDDFRKYVLSYNGPNITIQNLKKIFIKLNNKTNNGAVQITSGDGFTIPGTDERSLAFSLTDGKFTGARQRDAHELLNKLFDYLNENDYLNFTKFKDSLLYTNYTLLKCDGEQYFKITTSEDDTILSLPIPSYHIFDISYLLTLYQTEAYLMTENENGTDKKLTVTSCKGETKHAQQKIQLVINTDNKWLVITLKRYNNAIAIKKNDSSVNINYNISLQTEEKTNANYEAVGAILHIGHSLNSGHYIYETLKKSPNNKYATINEIFNDSVYTSNKEFNKLSQTIKNYRTNELEENCYIILYKRI
jgi:ubiquitin C-terminal hydrolase